ncbi:hypothetical protein K2Z84_20065 [Candidatus Binatia bacterium]|nr:hypothetical protein [Candidatus Binatia bacterium]
MSAPPSYAAQEGERRGTPRQRHAAILLCVLAALRMLVVVGPTPMRGYANNYDFVRVAAWFDLWALPPAGEPTFDPLAQHHRAPLRCYRRDATITSPARYPTTELGVVWLALRVNDAWRALTGPSDCELDLRVLGLLRAGLLLGVGCSVTWAFFRRSPRAGIASAAIVAGVLADPAVTLLFNTLYSDFSTILLTYLACALIVHALAFERFGARIALLLGATLLALAGTKTQYAGLSLVLVVVLALGALVHPHRHGRAKALVVAVAAACAVAGLQTQRHALRGDGYMWAMSMATGTDVFLGAIVPLHENPDRALALLGLPASCRRYVGRTWYDEGMQPPPCPEVGTVSRARLVRLLLDDPALGFRLAARALPLLQRMIVRDYGQVEGDDLGQADAHWWTASVSRLTEALPTWLYAGLLALTALATGAATVTIARAPADDAASGELLLPLAVAVAAAVEGYAFTSSLVGDGFIDLARHSLTGQLAFLVLVPAGALLLARTARGWRDRERRERRRARAAR